MEYKCYVHYDARTVHGERKKDESCEASLSFSSRNLQCRTCVYSKITACIVACVVHSYILHGTQSDLVFKVASSTLSCTAPTDFIARGEAEDELETA